MAPCFAHVKQKPREHVGILRLAGLAPRRGELQLSRDPPRYVSNGLWLQDSPPKTIAQTSLSSTSTGESGTGPSTADRGLKGPSSSSPQTGNAAFSSQKTAKLMERPARNVRWKRRIQPEKAGDLSALTVPTRPAGCFRQSSLFPRCRARGCHTHQRPYAGKKGDKGSPVEAVPEPVDGRGIAHV